jgi:ankyrin repeat protein
MACDVGALEDVRVLLWAGADVTLEGVGWVEETVGAPPSIPPPQKFPLGAAARKGHADVVKLLLAQEGVDVNQGTSDKGRTALYSACYAGHTEVVEMLLACEAVDVNLAKTDDGATPLYAACEIGHTKVVELLLACDGIAVNKARLADGCTPLSLACSQGRHEVVKLLLACDGIAVNQACTDNAATPLHAAALDGYLSITQLLVVFGANVAALATFEGEEETPQKWAADDEHLEVAEWLGAVAGWSPLRVAAGCRLPTPITTMLKLGRMDPDNTQPWSQLALARATSTTPPTELPWQDAPDVCQITVKLIKAATQGWAPPRHWLYHAGVRTAVHTVLQVCERLYREHVSATPEKSNKQCRGRRGGATATTDAKAVLPILPLEMWIVIMGFFLRRNWAML